MSIAQEICRITREQVGVEGCARVVRVGIEVGPFSGVEPDNLVFWLEILLREPPFTGAEPLIHPAEGDVLRVSYLEVEDGEPEDEEAVSEFPHREGPEP
jgi:Zn finger protein HypA/HybF involved in hydrogenase expression